MNRPSESLFRGTAGIVFIGLLLGLVYNYVGLASDKPWGLAWIGTDRAAEFAELPVVGAAASVPVAASDDPLAPPVVISDDPLAPPPTSAPALSLPEIPDVGRPVPINLDALRQFVEADAAMIIDARDAYEFEEGHIPGAINLPYEQAISDPALLESLDPQGKVMVTYCGGGTCEVSISLADELYYSIGFKPVAVYMGGFPEWVEAGYAVADGGEEL